MTTEPETERRVYPRENSQHWIGVSAEDIPPGWIDDMVKRLFDELNRQMIRAEKASSQESDKKDAQGNYPDNPDKREKNARVLARLQTQLERLTDMEMDRASLRATKNNRTPTETRAAIRRKVLAAIDAGRARARDGGSE